MKKTIWVSLLVSTVTIAGTDRETESDWEFKGQGVAYHQTTDAHGNGNLFKQSSSKAALGLQLSAVNKDVVGGIGVGFELSGLSGAGLLDNLVGGMVQNAGGETDAALTQAYLTYGINNTNFKIGRQTLSKALSPLAFSEGWNPFKNTFEAAVVVNTDIPNTTLVGAYVTKANNSVGDLSSFQRVQNSDKFYMITAQNKGIENLTLTGSFYLLDDVDQSDESQQALWADASYKISDINSISVQAGTIYGDYTDSLNGKDSNAFGIKFSTKLGKVNTTFAYTSANDGTIRTANLLGAGVKSPLYTQGVLNQNTIKKDADTFKVTGSIKAWGGSVIAAYMHSDLGDAAIPSVFGTGVGGKGTYQEFELMFKKKMSEHVNMFFGYVRQNDNRQGSDDGQNFFRVWARYTF